MCYIGSNPFIPVSFQPFSAINKQITQEIIIVRILNIRSFICFCTSDAEKKKSLKVNIELVQFDSLSNTN